MKSLILPIAKSLAAGAVAFTGAAAVAAADDTITTAEWWTVAAATVAALTAVYLVPNKTDDPAAE